jgi:hypothetical protein
MAKTRTIKFKSVFHEEMLVVTQETEDKETIPFKIALLPAISTREKATNNLSNIIERITGSRRTGT